MNAPTKTVTANIPLGLAEQLEEVAARMHRSPEWAMEQALAAWLADEEEDYRLTLEGLADFDAGRTIPHEKMVAWAASLGTDHPLPMPECE